MSQFKIRYFSLIFVLIFTLIIGVYFNYKKLCLSFIPYGVSDFNYVTLGSDKDFCLKIIDKSIKFITNEKGARIIKNKSHANLKVFGDSQVLGLEVNSHNDYFLREEFNNNSFEVYAAPNNGPYEVINRINELEFNPNENVVINFNISVDIYRLNDWYPENFISLHEKHIDLIHQVPFLADIFMLYNILFKNNFTIKRSDLFDMQALFLEQNLNTLNYELKIYLDDLNEILFKKNITATLIFSTPYWLYSSNDASFKILNMEIFDKYKELISIIENYSFINYYSQIKFARTKEPTIIQRYEFTSDNRHIKNYLLKKIIYFN